MALDALNESWGGRYPAMNRMWQSCWNAFIPFLDYDTEIRRVLCFINTRRKYLCLVTQPLALKGTRQTTHSQQHSPTECPAPTEARQTATYTESRIDPHSAQPGYACTIPRVSVYKQVSQKEHQTWFMFSVVQSCRPRGVLLFEIPLRPASRR